MAESQNLKIACPSCTGHVEFPSEMRGQIINCPHCGLSMSLDLPGAPPQQSQPPPIAVTPQIQTAAVQSAPPVLNASLLLPEITDESLKAIQVRSSDGEHYYSVNLMDYTCTCPSFIQVHSAAPPRDVGRLCKHICWELKRPEILPRLDPICLAMVREGFGIYPGRLDRDNNGNPIYITGVNTQGWLNVFALKRRDGKTYYRFGYNVNEGRWAYGSRPKINEAILYPKGSGEFVASSSSGLGWQIFRAVLRGLGKILAVLAQVAIYILIGIFGALLGLAFKSRRRRF